MHSAGMAAGSLVNMAEIGGSGQGAQLTTRGAATRTRILRTAADLMYDHGVDGTTLDAVRLASGTSKSQLYRHFSDKDALVRGVVSLRASEILGQQRQRLLELDSMRGLELWRDAILQRDAARGLLHGCELGSLANELADHSEEARVALAGHFQAWERLLADGIERMRTNGTLRAEADSAALATSLMAALQGGYLLAETARSSKPMEIALEMGLAQIRGYAT